MGVSTDGQLSFGVAFDEGHEFPWDDEKYDGEIEDWWKGVNGYSCPVEDPFTPEGQYKPGFNRDSPEVDAFFKHSRDWFEENPIPVEVVNYCSGDCPMYLLAVKHIECSRGYPQEIEPSFLEVSEEEQGRLQGFLDRFEIKDGIGPKWWLTSYWG